ncbi:hypothetical protein DPMN_182625 [Dreissena polymorpha]|uniref:Uncharacterized protein n=1 Tax=Dreissena polymorpha TaxID=45954 RepID=A0A9D4DEJ5_DREPO|nr:hypothetical protein DPMN_182625 [Dreissena polymorpha]
MRKRDVIIGIPKTSYTVLHLQSSQKVLSYLEQVIPSSSMGDIPIDSFIFDELHMDKTMYYYPVDKIDKEYGLRSVYKTSDDGQNSIRKSHHEHDELRRKRRSNLCLNKLTDKKRRLFPPVAEDDTIAFPGDRQPACTSSTTVIETPNDQLHGIEPPGQTDTFRSLSETELEPRNHRSRMSINKDLCIICKICIGDAKKQQAEKWCTAALDAVYRQTCHINFRTNKAIPAYFQQEHLKKKQDILRKTKRR